MAFQASKLRLQLTKGPQNNQNAPTTQGKKNMDRVQF